MRLILGVESGGSAGREYVLAGEGLTLGRDEGCAVRFDSSETQVSRHHARIEAVAEGFQLTDRHSTNGVYVNGRRVDQVLLKAGDLVQLGDQGPRLRVRFEPMPSPPFAQRVTRAEMATTAVMNAALYNPERDKGRRYGLLSIAVVLGMILLGGALGILFLLTTAFQLGLWTALVGVLVAFAASPIYLLIWLWLDRYDPEPAWVLAGCAVWGAGAATFVSGVLNTLFGSTVFSLTGSQALTEFLTASISAPLVEEAAKGLAVVLVFLVLRREFDGIIDGIAYAGVVALGFATVENVLYYGRILAKEGAPGLFVVFVLRGVLGPFSHSVFTSMIGIGCGIARQTHNQALLVLAPLLGYLAAVALHFLWNTLAALSGGLSGFLLLYLVIWVPLFLGFFVMVLFMNRRESRLIRRMLQAEVATGLVTREQAEIVASWPRRLSWLLSGLRAGGGRFGARRRFLYSATRLALSYWHAERAAAAGGHTLSLGQIPLFRKEVQTLRPAI